MLLSRTVSMRIAVAAIVAHVWPGVALAQAQVEAVPDAPPAFDMWDLEAIENPALELPIEPIPPPPPGSAEVSQPPTSGANDPCRHFTEEERRLLPSLCGSTD